MLYEKQTWGASGESGRAVGREANVVLPQGGVSQGEQRLISGEVLWIQKVQFFLIEWTGRVVRRRNQAGYQSHCANTWVDYNDIYCEGRAQGRNRLGGQEYLFVVQESSSEHTRCEMTKEQTYRQCLPKCGIQRRGWWMMKTQEPQGETREEGSLRK